MAEAAMVHFNIPDGRTRQIRQRRRRFWCFKCRKRQLHRMLAFFPDSPYYDPHSWYQCDVCKGDHTQFPAS